MHSPEIVAFEIKNPFVRKDKHGYRTSLLTIWHIDPEKDGTDDSCGWFIRSRHIDPALLEKVRKEFEFQYKHNYWFDETGKPKFSAIALALQMYRQASWVLAMWLCDDKPTDKAHRIHTRFMRTYIYEILQFAENPTDCLFFGPLVCGQTKYESADWYAGIVLADILRKRRKWHQHPRWHIHHWQLQFHPWQNLKRRYWDKCSVCGKRGFNGSAMSDWHGTKIWHQECDSERHKVSPEAKLAPSP